MTQQGLILERRDGVGKITLNRPERLNSLTRPLLQSLLAALEDMEQDPEVRAVVLAAKGRAFCAGQDLDEPLVEQEDAADALAESLNGYYHPVLLKIVKMEVPVIACVQGIAAGAGCNLALACDLVLAGESASFLQAFARIGLVPDCGGTWLLPRLVGAARAKALMMLAEPLPAKEAESMGLIYRCLGDDDLERETEALANRLAEGPTLAYGLLKKALSESQDNGLEQQLTLEAASQRTAAASADFREGLAAFKEKRKPRFSGS